MEKRASVWLAFSDLWLDTEPDDNTYNYIVRCMVESGYSLDQLADIFSYEVAPAVYTNLYNMFPGGVWGAFNIEWLLSAILENIEKQERSKTYHCWVRSWLGQKLMTGMVKKDWEKIQSMYVAKFTSTNLVGE